ncbi:MAG: DUF1830 domain-containing protein [Synechococcaceae cyanobacterium SM2_3_2]|nr:DUF1830 domain-containing protein [Synechococcaceae cyanobacterium SM2_3_2]
MKSYAFTNRSDDVQVVRTSDGHLERTLFPGQQVVFEADPDQFLEIYSHQWMSNLLVDRWPCHTLNPSEDWDIPVGDLVSAGV